MSATPRQLWIAIASERARCDAAYRRMRLRLEEAGIAVPDPTGDIARDLYSVAIAVGFEDKLNLDSHELRGLTLEEIEAHVDSCLRPTSRTSPKRRKNASTIERDAAWLTEFERDSHLTVAYFAQSKNVSRDTMSKALKRARKSRESSR